MGCRALWALGRTWAFTPKQTGARGGFRALKIQDLICIVFKLDVVTLKNSIPLS